MSLLACVNGGGTGEMVCKIKLYQEYFSNFLYEINKYSYGSMKRSFMEEPVGHARVALPFQSDYFNMHESGKQIPNHMFNRHKSLTTWTNL
ncbi:hypothetical protein MTR_7g088800 [Medicago truncatula]|uniref:Uncharacterized protein n=1 Tax=Medicago truncatula TaxID=3880 RepID=G7L4V1_MEDTR|nr:hypothetical protein MTR_7g088800 [Medicago truncatula]